MIADKALLIVCLVGLAVCLAALLIAFASKWLRQLRGGMLVFAVFAALYGGSKSFSFLNGVSNAGSTATNDTVTARWTANSIVMDGNYELLGKYRDSTMTNELGEITDDWHDLPTVDAHLLEHEYQVANATNMDYVFWANYLAPVIVHTNGVYHLAGLNRAMTDDYQPDTNGIIWVLSGSQVRGMKDDGTVEVLTPTNIPPAAPLLMSIQPED